MFFSNPPFPCGILQCMICLKAVGVNFRGSRELGAVKKILIVSDIHGHGESLARVLAANEDAELVIVAGDLTNFGSAAGAREMLAILDAARFPLHSAAVAGNCDPLAVRRCLTAADCDLEGRLRELPFATLTGAGGRVAPRRPYEL